MSIITRNEYGAVAVNKVVIERMIIEDMLAMSDSVIMCNKNAKPIKDKPTPFIDPDYFDSVEVSDKKDFIKVKVYIIVRFGNNISETADRLLDTIENDFALLKLRKPDVIKIKVRGIMSDELVKRNIDVVRKND